MNPHKREETGILPPLKLQQDLAAAIISNDRRAVRDLLDQNPDVEATDANHYTALMHAAASGDLEIVRLLLPICVAHEEAVWLVQQAFEVAVETGHPRIAHLLIDIGADPDWAFVGMAQGWERCPICLTRCCPSTHRICAHWICTSDAQGFTWFASEREDFEVEVDELVSLAFDFFARPDADELFSRCPAGFQTILRRIEEHGRYYWALDEQIHLKRHDGNASLEEPDLHFYGTAPRLGSRIKARAISLAHWLRIHCA